MSVLAIITTDCSTPEVTTPSGSPTLSPDPNLHPTFIMRNLSPTSMSDLFSRASQATLIFENTYRLVQVNQIRFDSDVNAYLIEPASTNYFVQDYDTICEYVSHTGLYVVSGSSYVLSDAGEYVIIEPDLPTSQTITINSTGYYTLWVNGECTATVSLISGSATMLSNTSIDLSIEPAKADYAKTDVSQVGGDGSVHIEVTSAPAVFSITITGAVDGDEVQFETGKWPTSYIPNTSTSGTTRSADLLYAPEV